MQPLLGLKHISFKLLGLKYISFAMFMSGVHTILEFTSPNNGNAAGPVLV